LFFGYTLAHPPSRCRAKKIRLAEFSTGFSLFLAICHLNENAAIAAHGGLVTIGNKSDTMILFMHCS